MNTHSRILSLYRAEVSIPSDVAQAFEFTREYGDFVCSFRDLDGRQGQTTRNGVIIEWHEGPSHADAVAFASRWEARISDWQNQLTQPSEERTVSA